MKAITIKQPWASFILRGFKDVENRYWKTDFRGKVLIHTSKSFDDEFYFTEAQKTSIPAGTSIKKGDLPFGAIVGEVEIIDCINNSSSVWAAKGQYHFILKNAILYPEPILNVRGNVKFWDYDK